MRKRSKRYKKLIEVSKNYKARDINEAIDLIKKTSTAKFDESIDAAFKINMKQSKAEVNLRTVVNLPHGNGKKIKIAVLCEDSKKEEIEFREDSSISETVSRHLLNNFVEELLRELDIKYSKNSL